MKVRQFLLAGTILAVAGPIPHAAAEPARPLILAQQPAAEPSDKDKQAPKGQQKQQPPAAKQEGPPARGQPQRTQAPAGEPARPAVREEPKQRPALREELQQRREELRPQRPAVREEPKPERPAIREEPKPQRPAVREEPQRPAIREEPKPQRPAQREEQQRLPEGVRRPAQIERQGAPPPPAAQQQERAPTAQEKPAQAPAAQDERGRQRPGTGQPPAAKGQPAQPQEPAARTQPGQQQPPAAQTQPTPQQPPAAQTQPTQQQPPAAQTQPTQQQPPAAQTQPTQQQPPAAQTQPTQPPPPAARTEPTQLPPPTVLRPIPGQPPAAQTQPAQPQPPAAYGQPGQPQAPAAQGQPGQPPAGQALQQPPMQRAPAVVLPAAPPPQAPAQPVVTDRGSIMPQPTGSQGQPLRRVEELRNERQEVREGDRIVIREPDRVIIREGNQTIIQHNETNRFLMVGREVGVDRRDGEVTTIVERPDGTRIVTVTDENGRLIRRVRRTADGREIIIIENRYSGPQVVNYNYYVDLPPPVVRIPRERYIVEAARTRPEIIYETLMAPPVEHISRRYTLEEVRYSLPLRDRMPRIDLDTITFDTGSWEITPDQVNRLAVIAGGINQVVSHNPSEVFLIEGHTDAVGSDVDNLSLSDRRAESVALALSERLRVPPENLTTQGYGEQYLKIPTQAAERQNRRVTVRRITPLLTGQDQSTGQAR